MKYIFTAFMLFLPLGLFAQALNEGENIKAISLKDQFEKNLTVSADTKQIIVAFTKDQGAQVKTFLDANPNYLSEQKALYFMDVTTVPGMVMSMFMLPKFKNYTYPVGLIEEKEALAYFPKKEGNITLITLDNLKVTAITFKEGL